MIAKEVINSVVEATTVNVPVPVATVLSGFVAIAVIVVVPCPTPVASPPEVMVATVVLLDVHVTWPVRFSDVPDAVVPIAMNWLV
jgi:hypothetical protein